MLVSSLMGRQLKCPAKRKKAKNNWPCMNSTCQFVRRPYLRIYTARALGPQKHNAQDDLAAQTAPNLKRTHSSHLWYKLLMQLLEILNKWNKKATGAFRGNHTRFGHSQATTPRYLSSYSYMLTHVMSLYIYAYTSTIETHSKASSGGRVSIYSSLPFHQIKHSVDS